MNSVYILKLKSRANLYIKYHFYKKMILSDSNKTTKHPRTFTKTGEVNISLSTPKPKSKRSAMLPECQSSSLH